VIITISITTIVLFVKSDAAFSAFLGGLICTLSNFYFARQLFTKRRTAVAGTLLRSAYVAEIIKLSLAVTLLAIVLINYKDVNPLTLFATYFIVHSCMWAVPLITQQTNNKTFNQMS
jgi:ATP synthase protein I